jgi:hypothetical protein
MATSGGGGWRILVVLEGKKWYMEKSGDYERRNLVVVMDGEI